MIPSRDRPLGRLLPPTASDTQPIRAVEPAEASRLDGLGTDALAIAASRGDTEAVAMLYDQLVDPIYRYVALRVRHREDAEDLTQVVFERLVAALPRYRSTGRPFEAWAFRIARNAIVDHQRRSRAHQPLDELPERGHGIGLDAMAVRGEELRELRAAMARLTADQQEAIALRYAAGLSADEAAAVMGRRAGTIRGLTFRAIAALRRHLDVDGGETDA
jgi:RNA polymerase sigma-70 factor (ECF subfamily)